MSNRAGDQKRFDAVIELREALRVRSLVSNDDAVSVLFKVFEAQQLERPLVQLAARVPAKTFGICGVTAIAFDLEPRDLKIVDVEFGIGRVFRRRIQSQLAAENGGVSKRRRCTCVYGPADQTGCGLPRDPSPRPSGPRMSCDPTLLWVPIVIARAEERRFQMMADPNPGFLANRVWDRTAGTGRHCRRPP